MTKCICAYLEDINGFRSPGEYERFIHYIESCMKDKELIETAVKNSYAGSALRERWFQCVLCNKTWRLVAPDFPFKGVFCRVE